MDRPTKKDILREELTKSDERQISRMIEKEVNKALSKSEFEKKVKGIMSKQYKKDKDFENEVVKIASNVVTQLFKTLWVRRNVWRTRLQNKAN